MVERRIAGLALTAMTAAAIAATPASAGDWGAEGTGTFGIRIGGLALVSPTYEGSADYRVRAVPFIMPSFGSPGSGLVDVNGPDDVRFRLFRHQGFEAGPLGGWRFSRDEEDGRRLWGLGDVDGGLVVGGYMAYRAGFLKPFLSYHHQVTGDTTGGVLRFGTEAIWELGRGAEIVASFGASWADDDYMNAYFSVTPAQAAASVAGLGVYDAGAGIKDVHVGATARIPLSELWTLSLMGRYTHLVGDAASSPLVESESQWTGALGVSYKIDWR